MTIGPAGSPRAGRERLCAYDPARCSPMLRRLLWAAGTLVLTAFFAYGMIRLLRPELYPGEALVGGTVREVRRALLRARARRGVHVRRLPADPGDVARRDLGGPAPARRRRRRRGRAGRRRRVVVRGAAALARVARARGHRDVLPVHPGLRGRVRRPAAVRPAVRPVRAAVVLRPALLRPAAPGRRGTSRARC